MNVMDAYRVLSDAYPEAIHPVTRQSIRRCQGKAKLRALSTVIQSDGDLAEAMAMITDETVREQIRVRLIPMLNFTPQP